ncbi:GMC family oxidoreductase [Shimia sp. R9_3]|uniref:GMC oxidoreductase n=1 Tax=Shimia sp. R9_3 TaxID=2821113 RepID=UPI001ADB5138|nr:GMC family oxidoreductase [Shimia sp. R9_3]MBO9401198.1 GMC family oxidoreductase [Shimia sp. R9_3]
MLKLIEIADAASRSWDMIIVGSSFASMFFLRALPSNLRVLIVEKGPWVSHANALDVRSHANALETIAMDNLSAHKKLWVAHSKFGGNSNCWWAQTPRFLPDDFMLWSRFGIGRDWPITYDTLEPYYSETEAIMEIAGDGREFLHPMSRPYPYPSHSPTRHEFRLRADSYWVPNATARSNGGCRAICCGNNVCGLCPIDAKFSILNGLELFDRDNTFLLLDSEVTRVLDLARTSVSGVEIRQRTNSYKVKADRVALAANAFFNASILLRSGDENPSTGRYIHEQASKNISLTAPGPGYYGGTSITGHNYKFYKDADRGARAAVLIENFNIPAIQLVPGAVTNTMNIKLIAEDIPQARNQVVLDDGGVPKVIWHGHHDYAYNGIDYAAANLSEIFPWPVSVVNASPVNVTEAHIQGTCRMGHSGDESVVDADLRKHGNDNLWVLGASAFPSSSPANPTLTLSALSLRAGTKVT